MPPEGMDKVIEPPRKAPSARLELEYVHGFRGHDTRQCAAYNKNGNAVWITAAVGIVYDKVNTVLSRVSLCWLSGAEHRLTK